MCFKCNQKGHLGSQCHSKTVAEVSPENVLQAVAEDSEGFLGAVYAEGMSSWMTSILLNEVETVFKLNTGAEVTAILKPVYECLRGVKLQPTSRLLYGPTRQPLKVLGQFQATLARSQKATTQTVFVIDALQTNLLGLPTISSLQLASTVNTCEEGADITQRFPSLFRGLGTLGDPYTIKLREGVQPHAFFTPRNVPIPLCPKVQKELERMERLKVIFRVTEPTPWCAGMVVVPKRSGDVRICVDLKPLNDGVL